MVYDLQKGSLWKRIAAWLFDGILTVVLAVGMAFLLSTVLGYNEYSDRVSAAYEQYEKEYGITFDISQSEYQGMTEQERETYDAAYQALISDPEAMHAYNMTISLSLVVISLAILCAILVLELIVPLILGNGQTLGKKIFTLCLVRVDGVKITGVQLFMRSILGKFAIETMVPVCILLMLFWGTVNLVSILVLLGLLIAQLFLVMLHRERRVIHDLLSGTAVADFGSQMIFGSARELIEYKKKIAADMAARQEY